MNHNQLLCGECGGDVIIEQDVMKSNWERRLDDIKSSPYVEPVLWKAITEGLKDCINDHGVIDKQFIGSAGKRILAKIMQKEALQNATPTDVKLMVRHMGAERSGFRTKYENKLVKHSNKLARRIRILRELLKKC